MSFNSDEELDNYIGANITQSKCILALCSGCGHSNYIEFEYTSKEKTYFLFCRECYEGLRN